MHLLLMSDISVHLSLKQLSKQRLPSDPPDICRVCQASGFFDSLWITFSIIFSYFVKRHLFYLVDLSPFI